MILVNLVRVQAQTRYLRRIFGVVETPTKRGPSMIKGAYIVDNYDVLAQGQKPGPAVAHIRRGPFP